jgi:hypothetical protein
MKHPIALLLLSAMLLGACGTVRESRLNPFNWFGAARSTPVADAAESDVNPLIPPQRRSIFYAERDTSYRGTEVAQVTGLFVERRPGGALIRAEGVVARQGAFDVRLIKMPEESDETTMVYALQALQPPRGAAGPESARRVTAAEFVTDNELAGIRTIRVQGATNAQTSRR